MQDFVGALSEALGFGAGTDDGDGSANVADAADGDHEPDLAQGLAGRINVHSGEDLERFAAQWADAFRTGAELIDRRRESFGLWRAASQVVRKSSARTLRPVNISLVQLHGQVHIWQWRSKSNVVWHSDSDCITGSGCALRLDMEQRAVFPINALITISACDDARVVLPDAGVRLFERKDFREYIPDWLLRMKRMWNLCLDNVPFGAACEICGKPNALDSVLFTCCLCDITMHASCAHESLVGCHAVVTSAQRSFLDLADRMPNIMRGGECRDKHFCALCAFVVFQSST